MTKQRTTPGSVPENAAGRMDEPLPAPDDPGDALRKGYSADPLPGRDAPEQGPIPLAADADIHGHVQRRDEDAVLPPTGRSEPPEGSARDRVMGADR